MGPGHEAQHARYLQGREAQSVNRAADGRGPFAVYLEQFVSVARPEGPRREREKRPEQARRHRASRGSSSFARAARTSASRRRDSSVASARPSAVSP